MFVLRQLFNNFLIVSFVAHLVLLFGCEQGRMSSNITDIMTDTISDTQGEPLAETEPELPRVMLDIDVQTAAIPEGVEILEDDRVFHIKELDSSYVPVDGNGDLTVYSRDDNRRYFEPFVFEDARSALTDEDVLTCFEAWGLYVETGCNDYFTGDSTASFDADFWVHFTVREEADKYAEQFADVPPWSVLRNVYILNGEEVYFAVRLQANASAKFCNSIAQE